MKKIILIVFAIFCFTSCDQFIAKKITIENNSSKKAIVSVKTFTGQGNENSSQDCEILAGKKITLSLYDNIVVDLKSVDRNYLKKLSNTQYQILNSSSVPFSVYNTTPKKVNFSDVNNLFDSTVINANAENININIFNPQKMQAVAITVPDGIILQTQIQGDKIIIKY